MRSRRSVPKTPIRRKTLALGLAAFILSAVAAGARENPDQQGIHAWFDQWKRAVETLDVEGVMSLYSGDFLQWGMTKELHKILYQSQFRSMRKGGGKLDVSLEVRNINITPLDARTDIAEVELVVARKETWGDDQSYIDRILIPLRLRRREGEDWRLLGDSSRTLPLAQIGYDGEDYVLILTAESAYPTFPAKSIVEGPGIDRVTLEDAELDGAGKPYVTKSLFLAARPEVGQVYTFHTPYPDGVEHLRVPLRSVVTEVPEIVSPPQDYDVTGWPVKVAWKPVSDRIKDFNCYEVHIRRAEDYKRVYLFRSIPPERTSILLGTTEEQRKAFGTPHVPYLVEVYAYDIYSNFAFSRRRIYNIVGVDEQPQEAAE